MAAVYRLSCPVRNYDWGSVDALPTLLGRPVDGAPQAEMWIGAHPSAPSLATDALGCSVPLDRLLHTDPLLLHGRFGGRPPRLPLLKVLAADRPLSLQVHPDAARAARRFAEQWPGYRDPWHKPEMIYALEPFEALCGFTRIDHAADLLSGLGVRGLTGLIAELSGGDAALGMRRAMQWLLTMEPRRAADIVSDVVAAARSAADAAYATVVELAAWYPHDPGVIVSLLLNRVTLEPGEAMFVPPNTMHSYLRGVGVEVMAASDNVVRAGLTGKRVDVAELLETTDYAPGAPQLVTPRRGGDAEQVFAPDVDEFSLSMVRAPSAAEHAWHDGLPRTVLCLRGSFSLAAGGTAVELERGDAVFIAAGAPAVHVAGTGIVASAAPRG